MTLYRSARTCVTKRGSILYGICLVGLVMFAAHLRGVSQDGNRYSVHAMVKDTKSKPDGATYQEPDRQLLYQGRQDINVETGLGENDGFKRAAFLRKQCEKDPASKSELSFRGNVRVSYDPEYKVLYCPLCKIASTFWTRVFKMLEVNRQGSKPVMTPFDIPINQAPASRQHINLLSNTVDGNDAKDSFRFMFVRSPYSLVWSAFVDKMVGPNPAMWKTFGEAGIKAIRKADSHLCGSDLTFLEFLQLIVYTEKSNRSQDCHVKQFVNCKPCAVDYSFIGKMETFREDTYAILTKLNQTQTLKMFDKSFSDLHGDDAIDDGTSGAFYWKEHIIKCMSWPEALGRVWRKLQIRGVVGAGKFPLSNEEALSITKEDFVDLVKVHRKVSSSSERSKLKHLAFQEAYDSVPVEVLEGIRNVYLREFQLFGYEEKPDNLYNKRPAEKVYGFLDYSNIKEDIRL